MTSPGFQVSSLKPYLTTPEQVRAAFGRLRDIGYRVLQIQWIDPQVPDESVAEALAETGLCCVGTQDFYHVVRDRFDRFVRMNRLWGSGILCVSGIPDSAMTAEGLRAHGAELRRMADALRKEGIALAFHPVFRDYAEVDGCCAVDRLMAELPEDVQLTVCIYHAVKAGLDAAELLRRHAGRVDIVHFKNAAVLPDGREALMPVGQGNIFWPPLFQVCHETGVKWGMAEQESWEKDAFLCARESFDYLAANGIVNS